MTEILNVQEQPRLDALPARQLIGLQMIMSLADNKTGELWRSFMPRRKEIKNTVSIDLYSLQIYPANYFQPFRPETEFVKWAAVEVPDFDQVPEGMETLLLPVGLYAVFLHKGGAATGPETFRYIFETWLPASGYELDNRPHFELLGEQYKNNDPDSEEEIWIPIKLKSDSIS